jgi:hypothetical protein
MNSGEKDGFKNNLFSSLYSKFMPQEESSQPGHKKTFSSNKSPFKNAGDFLRRKISGDDNDLFEQAEEKSIANERYHKIQITDTLGKGEIDEKIIMKVTGAKEPLKKSRMHRGGFDGDGVNVFDILQMFRENHAGLDREDHGGMDPFQQIIMQAVNADNDPDRISEEDFHEI